MNNARSSEVINFVAELKPNFFNRWPLCIDHVMPLSFHTRSSGTPACCGDQVSHKRLVQTVNELAIFGRKFYFSLCLVLPLNYKKCKHKQNFSLSLMNTADCLNSNMLWDICATTSVSDLRKHTGQQHCVLGVTACSNLWQLYCHTMGQVDTSFENNLKMTLPLF